MLTRRLEKEEGGRWPKQNLKNCSTLESRRLSIFQAKLTMIISRCKNHQFAIRLSLPPSLLPVSFLIATHLLPSFFFSSFFFHFSSSPFFSSFRQPCATLHRGFLSSGRLKTALKTNSGLVSWPEITLSLYRQYHGVRAIFNNELVTRYTSSGKSLSVFLQLENHRGMLSSAFNETCRTTSDLLMKRSVCG